MKLSGRIRNIEYSIDEDLVQDLKIIYGIDALAEIESAIHKETEMLQYPDAPVEKYQKDEK